MSPPPVIIIGAARSGTKILRDLLAASKGVAAVPYDVNYVWRFGAPSAANDRLDPTQLTPRRADFIRRTLPVLAKADAGDVLLEKSVSNTLRVRFVSTVYPQARYVHLVRDGRDVVASAMRQWQARPDWRALWSKLRGMPLSNASYAMWMGGNLVKGATKGRGGGQVWGPRFAGIEQVAQTDGLAAVCAHQWVQSIQRAHADFAASGQHIHHLQYEQMVDAPAEIGVLAEALHFPDPDAVQTAAKTHLRPQGRAFNAVSRVDQKTILGIIGPTLAKLGYT